MIRVVLDSNVFVSALLFGGNPWQVVAVAVSGSIELCTSDSIRSEVERTEKPVAALRQLAYSN